MAEVRITHGDNVATSFTQTVYDGGGKPARTIASIHYTDFRDSSFNGATTGSVCGSVVHHKNLERAITGIVE